jgi:hypothetical protein
LVALSLLEISSESESLDVDLDETFEMDDVDKSRIFEAKLDFFGY